MQVGLLEDRDSRWYVFPGDPEREPYESVTTILSATESAPWLAAWGAKEAAKHAVRHLPLLLVMLGEMGPDAVVKEITRGARGRREAKREIGSHQHHILEALLTEAPIPDVPDHLAGVEVDGERVDLDAISDGFLNWLIDFGVEDGRMTVELTEATISNEEHLYAGTLDAMLRFDPPLLIPGRAPIRRLLVDCATGRIRRRKHAQMAAYRRCDLIWLDWLGNVAALPWADASAILHIDPAYRSGYRLLLMPEDDEPAYRRFLRLKEELHDAEREDALEFRPVYPPTADGGQPPPRLEDLPPGMRGALGKLQAAGYTDLGQVPRDRAGLLGVKGIGPVLLELVAGLFDAYGLEHALRGPEVLPPEVRAEVQQMTDEMLRRMGAR